MTCARLDCELPKTTQTRRIASLLRRNRSLSCSGNIRGLDDCGAFQRPECDPGELPAFRTTSFFTCQREPKCRFWPSCMERGTYRARWRNGRIRRWQNVAEATAMLLRRRGLKAHPVKAWGEAR